MLIKLKNTTRRLHLALHIRHKLFDLTKDVRLNPT